MIWESGGRWRRHRFGSELGRDIAAENAAGFTALSALLSAESDLTNAIDEANQRYSRPPGGPADIYILVHCIGDGFASWECSPWGPYAQYLASGWSPYVSGELGTLNARANALGHMVNNTGVQALGNPCAVAGFYAASATGGALASAGPLGELASEAINAAPSYWPSAFAAAYRWFFKNSLTHGPGISYFLMSAKQIGTDAVAACK